MLNGDLDERIKDCKQAFIQVFNLVFYRVFIDRLWTSRSVLLLSGGESVNNKETDWWPTSQSPSNIVCLVGVNDTSETQYNHNQISMVVADGLAPIWRQGICNHSDGVAQSVRIKSAQDEDTPKWICSVVSRLFHARPRATYSRVLC